MKSLELKSNMLKTHILKKIDKIWNFYQILLVFLFRIEMRFSISLVLIHFNILAFIIFLEHT